MILFLNFPLKIKTHSHNLKVFSKSFHDETVRYKKVLSCSGLKRRNVKKVGISSDTTTYLSSR